MLKASCLALICIIALFHEVKMEMCYPKSIQYEIFSKTNDATKRIEPGTTKTLKVTCSVDTTKVMSLFEFGRVSSITLLFSWDRVNYDFVARINNNSGTIEATPNVKKRGLMVHKGISYLTIKWTNPDSKNVGIYRCDIEGKPYYDYISHNCSDYQEIHETFCYTSTHIEVLPTNAWNRPYIEPELIEKLIVNCSFNFHTVPVMARLESLTLVRYDSKREVFQEVASIRKDKPLKINDSEAEGNGAFRDKSYIYMEWAYPGYKTAGEYICIARGVTHLTNENETCSSVANATFREASFASVAQQLRSYKVTRMKLLGKNKRLNETVKLLNVAVQEIKDEDSSEKKIANIIESNLKKETLATLNNLFHVSKLYKRRKYCLAKSASIVYPQLAQDTCAKYKGYLAEIGDTGELKSVREFLTSNKGARGFNILISGSDEIVEGKFLSARNNMEVKPLSWGKKQPDGKNIQNCLYLQFDSTDWKYFDTECVRNSTNVKFSYLCEIEEK